MASAKKSLKGTWPQALFTFFAPIALVFSVRWILFEPFVIPSESMVPNLLVHDHLFVNKSSFGLRKPFGDGFLWMWGKPKRGDIVVFRYPPNPEVFYIKRLIGLPGDEVIVKNGRISVNGQVWSLEEKSVEDKEVARPKADDVDMREFVYFEEDSGSEKHIIRFYASFSASGDETIYKVPENSYFMMGDNRDQSADSRSWGYVPQANLIGRAAMIWLSCENTLPTASFVCDPTQIRWSRLLTRLK